MKKIFILAKDFRFKPKRKSFLESIWFKREPRYIITQSGLAIAGYY